MWEAVRSRESQLQYQSHFCRYGISQSPQATATFLNYPKFISQRRESCFLSPSFPDHAKTKWGKGSSMIPSNQGQDSHFCADVTAGLQPAFYSSNLFSFLFHDTE